MKKHTLFSHIQFFFIHFIHSDIVEGVIIHDVQKIESKTANNDNAKAVIIEDEAASLV